MRADQLLVQRALAPTRSAAQRLIESGGVRWNGPKGWAVPRKAGEDLPVDCQIEVTDDAELRFVSRGGLKLDAALKRCAVAVEGKTCLDVGQGTGGFTDVVLKTTSPVLISRAPKLAPSKTVPSSRARIDFSNSGVLLMWGRCNYYWTTPAF